MHKHAGQTSLTCVAACPSCSCGYSPSSGLLRNRALAASLPRLLHSLCLWKNLLELPVLPAPQLCLRHSLCWSAKSLSFSLPAPPLSLLHRHCLATNLRPLPICPSPQLDQPVRQSQPAPQAVPVLSPQCPQAPQYPTGCTCALAHSICLDEQLPASAASPAVAQPQYAMQPFCSVPERRGGATVETEHPYGMWIEKAGAIGRATVCVHTPTEQTDKQAPPRA